MMNHKLLLISLVIIIMCLTAGSAEAKQRRSSSELEYVMRVLEEQGRLGEVDDALLRRIQSSIQNNKNPGKIQRKSKQSGGSNKPSSSPRDSVLSLARARQQQLFGSRSPSRSPLLGSSPPQFPQFVGAECQAFKTENSILKQQLLAAETELQQFGPGRTLQFTNRFQVVLLLHDFCQDHRLLSC